MKNIAENNLIRFTKITKKKEMILVHFKVNGVKNGTTYHASVSVDLAVAEMDLSHSMEKIIEGCAKIAVREFQKSDVQFEGLMAI